MTSTKRFYNDDDDDDDEGLPPSPSSVTQTYFLEYLKLGFVKKPIITRPCSVMILGSKCSICKREFKCITDTRKHMRKKHKYVKRKADDKLVRIKLKMGKETFCDNTISKKFLRTPERGSEPIVYQSTSDSQPLQISNIRCPSAKDFKNVSQNLLAKLSVPLSVALFDIKSLDQSAIYKNGRIYKERNVNSDHFANVIPNDSVNSSSSVSKSTRIEDKDWDSDGTWDLNSGSASDSENTVIYVSDVDVDLSEFYEDIKTEKVDSDVEDAETVVMPNSDNGDDALDTGLDDLDDITPENLEAMGKTCEDMDLAHMYDDFGLTDNGLADFEQFCQSFERTEVVNPRETETVQKETEIIQRRSMEEDVIQEDLRNSTDSRKRPHEVDTTQTCATEAKTSRKSLEINQSDQKEREATRKRLAKETENTIKLVKEMAEILKDISKTETTRKNPKRSESRNSRENSTDNVRSDSRGADNTRRYSREADSNRRNSREIETTRQETRDVDTTRRGTKDKKFIGIRLKKLEATQQQHSQQIQENVWQAETIGDQQIRETISNDLEIIEPQNLKAANTIPTEASGKIPNNSETIQLDNSLEISDHLDISDEDLEGIRLGCPSFEDVEKVRQRLEASDNNFVDLTETNDAIGGDLEASEVTFSWVVQNVRNKRENIEDKDQDCIIIDNDETDEQSEPQLEDFLQAAVVKYVQECKANSSTNWDNNNNNNKNNEITNLKHSSKFNYHFKKALMKLGITIATSPQLIKDEII